jgi:MFS family permease
MAIFENMSR